MFKILVADDERFIRKGIISILERDLEEKVECFEARNGQEALEIANTENPNLIVTDISMPGLDGLEFIKLLKETNNSAQVIILSGYENFDFARKAIKLGVKEYVMKPIKKREFLELIRSYVSDIKTVQARTNDEIIRNIENNKIMEQIKHDLLVGLLNCPSSEEAEKYLVKLKSLGIYFQSMLFACALVQYHVNEENVDYLDFAVANILEEYINLHQGNGSAFIVKYDIGKAVVIFEGADQNQLQEPKKKLLRKVGQLIKEYYQINVFFGLGDVAYDLVHLHTSLRHALFAVDFKIYGGGDNIEVYSEIDRGSEYKNIGLEKILISLETANAIQAANFFDRFIHEPKSRSALRAMKNAYLEYQTRMEKAVAHLQYLESKPNLTVRNFNDLWSFLDLKREVKDGILQLQEVFQNGGLDSSNLKLRADIVRYIQNNITNELDLNIVAEHFSRTPGYISTLFKKGMGGGFNAYITNERIKIAKSLLKDSTVPIQQIGELCGYPNSKYFSVVFRKVTGESPKSYREYH
jgi:two-component system response regulator YesN